MKERLGLIAGNGRFPFLVLEATRQQGIPVTVAAIREETDPAIEEFARGPTTVHWVGLGQLGKLIRIFTSEGVGQALMAGQVKHVQIFAPGSVSARRLLSALPDWRMVRLLASLPRKDTSSLIGGIAGVLRDEGIELVDSTAHLRHLVPEAGNLTRPPDERETQDIEYGHPLARRLAELDLGQTLVLRDRAVVAVEAMEGTDQTIRRAHRLASGQPLTLIKAARPNQEMRFDVPVIGLKTLDCLEECRVSAVAVDAGRTLILDLDKFVDRARDLDISVVAL